MSDKPSLQFINDFADHQEALLQEGECVNTNRVSTKVKMFFFLTQWKERLTLKIVPP